jgi:hypothetical protein
VLIYKKKKSINLFFIFFSLILLASIIPLQKDFYTSLKYKLYDSILSNNVGFSVPQNLINGGLGSSENISALVYKFPEVVRYFFSDKNSGRIDSLYIDIKFKNYLVILEDRKKALNNNLGSDFNEVNASFNYKNKKYKAKIRLKGDLQDHWRSKKRLSFRVKLKGDNTINGFKSFSIHKPESRQHPYDQLFQSLVRKVGNLAPNHNYMHVYVNDDYWGVMNIEEHVSKEFLELQGYKDSIVFEFDRSERFWKYGKEIGPSNVLQNYRLNNDNMNIEVFNAKKKLTNEFHRKWFSYVSDAVINETDSSLYDINSFSKNIFLSLMWSNTHTLSPQNSRYYFNPYTLTILPITTDQGGIGALNSPHVFAYPYNKIFAKKENLDSIEILDVNEMIKKMGNLQDEMNYYQSYFPLDEQLNTNVLKENLEKLKVDIKPYIKTSEKNKDNLLSPTLEQVEQLPDHIYARHYENGELHIYNLVPENIRIDSISLKNKQIFNDIILYGFKEKNKYQPIIVKTDLVGIYDNSISIDTNYRGVKRKFNVGYTHLIDGLFNPLLPKSKQNDRDYLFKLNENTYEIKQGEWNISKPIIIDGNLVIKEGTILKFSKDSYLIVKGSISAIGSKYSRIIFTSLEDTWKGIYILNSKNKSVLKHVSFLNTEALSDGLLDLTGGVTFYKSNVDILNTEFLNSHAEDSLNIVHSNFLLKDVVINQTISDGFDSDFSKGSIQSSRFVNINGDAIDFSGTSATIDNSYFKAVHDKAVSVGEESVVSIRNSAIRDVGVGIASKDGSSVNGNNIKISDFSLGGLMAYRKKGYYDYPKIRLTHVEIDNKDSAFIREEGAEMFINLVEIKERNLNVKELYEGQVMKK